MGSCPGRFRPARPAGRSALAANSTRRKFRRKTEDRADSGQDGRFLTDDYVERILAPTLQEGDIVILDNLAAHGSAKAAKILESIGPGGTFSMMELLRAIRVEPSRANQIRVAAYLKENLGFEKSVQKRRSGGRPKLWTVPEHIRPVDNSLADRKDPQSQDE